MTFVKKSMEIHLIKSYFNITESLPGSSCSKLTMSLVNVLLKL